MAQGRVDLQPPTTVAASTDQEVRFAGRVPGGAKSGLIVVTVTNPAGAGSLNILTSPEPDVDPTLWKSVGSVTTLTANGVQTGTTTGVADYIRWSVTGMSGGPLRFSVAFYAFDA